MTYHPTANALLLVDPDNHFLSKGGKVWKRVKSIANEVKALDGAIRGARPSARSQGGGGSSEECEVLMAARFEAWRNLP